jgi:hypothetical protein
MSNWIYLSKNNDQYMSMLATGAGAAVTDIEQWQYHDNQSPVVIRGIMKHKLIKQCWQDGRRFRYMDSGYLGNKSNPKNPHGWKFWHRIVPNNLQHDQVLPRPGDRLARLNVKIQPRQQSGSEILIAAPDDKPCIFYGIDQQQWLDQTVATIRQHTDRPIRIRQRTASRRDRVNPDTSFESQLHSAWAVVTYNSIAATESVIAGVPAFVLAPCNAALPVSNTNLANIDNPWFPDQDQVEAWARHLSYGQFHVSELTTGVAARILDETEEMLNA